MNLEELSAIELCGGFLHKFRLEDERLVRVWTPPGWTRDGRTSSALWLNDGQNLFRDEDAFGGASWKAADTVSQLISTGSIPPIVVVGVDHAGANRSLEFLPVPPTGWDAPWGSGMRGDMTDAPGGGVEQYTDRLITELLPWAEERFSLSKSPSARYFGGSSFGGICALYMAMRYPELWAGVIVESPSFWACNGRIMEDVRTHTGAWPQRMFMAMGELEYTGFRGIERQGSLECDAFLRDACAECASLLAAQGLGQERLAWFIEQGGRHNERDWGRRFPCALRWLMPLASYSAVVDPERAFWTHPEPILPGSPFEILVERAESKPGEFEGVGVRLVFEDTHSVQTCVLLTLLPACLSAPGAGKGLLAALAHAPEGVKSIKFALTNSDVGAGYGEQKHELLVRAADTA
eukprot:TRINITY_DN46727_c0_g1_i1.p1 TRINITY_DN46727_c0_g1~~TRINITY_DN46727_c0_g1_i1.p1  ORF type:complete len:417 (+),score=58.86 TRINITY_DN46727_c0_g1_i1:33-1253(+)